MLIVDAVALDAGRRGSGSSNPVPQSLSPLPSRRVKLKASEKNRFTRVDRSVSSRGSR